MWKPIRTFIEDSKDFSNLPDNKLQIPRDVLVKRIHNYKEQDKEAGRLYDGYVGLIPSDIEEAIRKQKGHCFYCKKNLIQRCNSSF